MADPSFALHQAATSLFGNRLFGPGESTVQADRERTDPRCCSDARCSVPARPAPAHPIQHRPVARAHRTDSGVSRRQTLRARGGYKRMLALLAFGAVCLGVIGVQNSAALPPAARPRQGEAFTFEIMFSGMVEAGRARLAVAPPSASPAGPQIHILGEVEATGFAKAVTGLHDDYRLVLDATTWLPRSLTLVESGQSSRTVVVQINDRQVNLSSKDPNGEKRWSGILPSPPIDPIAVLLLLRTARLNDGDKLTLVVIDASVFYLSTIEVAGREDTTGAFGTRRAIKLICSGQRIDENGQKLARPLRSATIWVSDDALRLPLRIEGDTELGKAEFALTSYEPGIRPPQRPKILSGIVEQLAP